jgi:hypothetical protein
MKNKLLLIVFAVIGSLTTWVIINYLLIELPIWKYLIIETIIVITKMLYEKEKKRLIGK